MPPLTYTIPGATVKFCVMNSAVATSTRGNPTENTIQYTVMNNNEFTQSFSFISNGISYTSLHVVASKTSPDLRKMYYIVDGEETLVYHNNQWTNEAFKTLTFETQSVREGIYGFITGISGTIYPVDLGVKVPAGKYKWKDAANNTHCLISPFESGDLTFCEAYVNSSGERYYYKYPQNNKFESVSIYSNGAWSDEKYKTITIPENCYIPYRGSFIYDNDFASLFEAVPTISFKHRFKNDALIGTGAYKFRRYSVEEPVSEETWIINESFDESDKSGDIKVSFTSGGTKFGQISIGGSSTKYYGLIYCYLKSNGAWQTFFPIQNGWTVDKYRTVVFDNPVTDLTLLAWLNNNAVKQ